MTPPLCRCPECRAGDALPEHLRGWPNAAQFVLIEGLPDPATLGAGEEPKETTEPDPAAVVMPLL